MPEKSTSVTDVTDRPLIGVTRAHACASRGDNRQPVTSVTIRHPDLTVLALDLGTTTGWALQSQSLITSGCLSLKPSRFDGGGMRYLRFRRWLEQLQIDAGPIGAVYFEEVRRHVGTDAAHVYGGLLGQLTGWCEECGIAYQGVPVGTIKQFATGKGNADKAAVIAAVRARGFSPVDDNEADAIAILLWAIETGGGVR